MYFLVYIYMKVGEKMNWIESIKKYNPYNEQEKKAKNIILKCIDIFDNILNRDNEIAHITSSAFIVNKTRDKVLMIHHNIFNEWSWTGGHADGEEDLLAVAIKEAKEEAGIKTIHPVTPDIFSLDILPVHGHIKRGQYICAHTHLSVAYLCEADENEILTVKIDENSGVKWIPIAEINSCTNESHMLEIYNKIICKSLDIY